MGIFSNINKKIKQKLLPDPQSEINIEKKAITVNEIAKHIFNEFKSSMDEFSFDSGKTLFFHEYSVFINNEDYEYLRYVNGEGLFAVIAEESVKAFYRELRKARELGRDVSIPLGNIWSFKFGSGDDIKHFNGKTRSLSKGDVAIIGRISPGTSNIEESLRVTFIPRQTNRGTTQLINPDVLKAFTYFKDGHYEIPYDKNLPEAIDNIKNIGASLAKLEVIIPEKEYAGKKISFLINEDDIIVTGKSELKNASNIFKIPSDSIHTPHLRIRYLKTQNSFVLASFVEGTMLNEKEVVKSDVNSPQWVVLPFNSKILLSGIVGVNFYQN